MLFSVGMVVVIMAAVVTEFVITHKPERWIPAIPSVACPFLPDLQDFGDQLTAQRVGFLSQLSIVARSKYFRPSTQVCFAAAERGER